MLAVKSTYLKQAVIKAALGEASFPSISNVYLALYTNDPTIGDTGTEVVGGSYARQQLSFANASGGAKASNTSETFSSMPATTVTHWGIRSASSGGNLLYFGAFDLPIQLNAGNNLVINSGDIVIGEV
jgi:hypothetical protein